MRSLLTCGLLFVAACAGETPGGPFEGEPRWQVLDTRAGRWIGLDGDLVPLAHAAMPEGITELVSAGSWGAWAWGRSETAGCDHLLALSPLGQVQRVEAFAWIRDVVVLPGGAALVLWQPDARGRPARLERIPRWGRRRGFALVPGGRELALSPQGVLVLASQGELAFLPEADPTWLEVERRVSKVRALSADGQGGFRLLLDEDPPRCLELGSSLQGSAGEVLAPGSAVLAGTPRGFFVGRPSAAVVEHHPRDGPAASLRLPARRAGCRLVASGGELLTASPTALFLVGSRAGRLELLASQGGFGRLGGLAAWGR